GRPDPAIRRGSDRPPGAGRPAGAGRLREESSLAAKEMIPPTSPILGIHVHMTTLDGALALAEMMIREGRRGYFCHVDTTHALAAHDDPTIRSALEGAPLACPDGMPLVWIGRRRGFPVGRTYGPDFMEGLTARTAAWTDRPCRHFLFGSSQTVLDR